MDIHVEVDNVLIHLVTDVMGLWTVTMDQMKKTVALVSCYICKESLDSCILVSLIILLVGGNGSTLTGVIVGAVIGGIAFVIAVIVIVVVVIFLFCG